MPKLIKLYIRHCLIGFAVAAAFVAVLLCFDVMNLWRLVSGSDSGALAVFLLWFLHGIVFAGVQFGWAVKSLAEKPDRGAGGPPVAQELAAMTVPAQRKRDDPERRPGR